MIDLPPPPSPVPPNPGMFIPPQAAPLVAAVITFVFIEIVFIGRYDNGFWLGVVPAFLVAASAGWLVRRSPWLAAAIALLASLFAFSA